MAKNDDTLPRQIAIRLSDDDIARLDAVHAQISVASRNAVARAAMRIGLAILEKDPARIIDSPPPKRGRKAR